MVKTIKEDWFGILLCTLSAIFLVFVAIVAAAPHDDLKMRGFAPCTFQMAYDLNLYSTQSDIAGVLGAIAESYVCYAAVMGEGVKLWLNGKQPTPWANYFFEPETLKVPEEMSEPFSEELLKANRLDDEGEEQGIFENYQENQNRETDK